jgi:NADH dehydrogenase FAD-containing subunit
VPDCFEQASSPGTDINEVKRLLTFAIVGGGPTSVEFAAELYDFLKKDVTRLYPDLYQYCNVILVAGAGHLLGSFQDTLVQYVESLFKSRDINVLTNVVVKTVDGHTATLSDGKKIEFGIMVWSTGVKPVPFIQHIDPSLLMKLRDGRIAVDDYLRVRSPKEGSSPRPWKGAVFALGDCAGNIDKPLPQLAQVWGLFSHLVVLRNFFSGGRATRTVPGTDTERPQH